MAAVSAAPKKEYKQLKNQKSKKSSSKKILVVVAVFLIAIILVFVSGAFDVSEIIVEENNIISDEQIISFSGIEKGTNLFAISKNDTISKLKENPYIDTVTIKRIFPNKLKLIIKERQKKYAIQLANSYIYIDKQGYILEISNDTPEVPIIIGFQTDINNIKPNDRLEESDLNKIKMIIKIMDTAQNNELANLITKIDISDESNYTIYLDKENKIAYLGDATELNTRFLYIKSILKEQQGKKGEIFVDMDLNEEYVYFRENT